MRMGMAHCAWGSREFRFTWTLPSLPLQVSSCDITRTEIQRSEVSFNINDSEDAHLVKASVQASQVVSGTWNYIWLLFLQLICCVWLQESAWGNYMGYFGDIKQAPFPWRSLGVSLGWSHLWLLGLGVKHIVWLVSNSTQYEDLGSSSPDLYLVENC